MLQLVLTTAFANVNFFQKPDDWLDDEPEFVPDPNGVKPDDWDEEEDGEWEAPQIGENL